MSRTDIGNEVFEKKNFQATFDKKVAAFDKKVVKKYSDKKKCKKSFDKKVSPACQQNWPKMGPCMFFFSPVPLTKRFALEV